MARFGQAWKPSRPPQQLSKASEPHNPPQQLSQASHLLCHGTFLGPTSCFYWASKLLRGTFLGRPSNPQNVRTLRSSFRPWYLPRPHKLFLFGTFLASLKTLKTSAAAFEGFRTSQPSAAAFGHGTSLGPTSCFYWASKLLRGTFWAGLKTLKTSAAAFEGFSQPSAAAFGHGASLGPTSCFYWASKVARFRQALKPSKLPQQLSKAWEPHNPPQQLSAMVPPLAPQAVSIGLRNCYVARFGQALKPSKPPQQLSKASEPHNPPQQLSQAPLALPWYIPRPHKLFLLGFETAMWHVFGNP